jgi:HEAT repeat protein
MDATSKKLLRLLREDQPVELRRAAVQVLAEVGTGNAETGRALRDLLADADAALRLDALRAVGKLRVAPALPELLQRITEGGAESEAAAHAAARLGPKGTRALRDLMGHVAPGLRRRIAGALTAVGTAGAESVALDALLDSDPGVVDAAARSLSLELPSLTAAQRKNLADGLLQLLKQGKKKPLPLASEAAILRLLAALQDGRAEAVYWERAEPSHPAEVRALALRALGTLGSAPGKDKLGRLLACAADADFRVAAPALMLLKTVTPNDRTLSDWLHLLEAPDVAVRRLALEKIGDRDSTAVAAALLRQLDHPDRSLRDQALVRLGQLDHGRQALAEAVLKADSPDRAWLLARSQAPFVRDYSKALREQLFKQACTHLEAGDRRADALLFLLREADPQSLRDRLEERGLALRKKKQYAKALACFRLLCRDPACGAPLRFELAASGLKLSSRDLSAEARAGDPCLEQFANLVHAVGAELLDYVKWAKWLEPEELFYLGFHFAEKHHQEQQFGGQVLHLVLERSPRSGVAKDAKSKLRREGLD